MDDKIFLIKYQNHSKKMVIPSEENIRSVFNILPNKKIFLQVYDDYFKQPVDLEWKDIHKSPKNILTVCEEFNTSINTSYINSDVSGASYSVRQASSSHEDKESLRHVSPEEIDSDGQLDCNQALKLEYNSDGSTHSKYDNDRFQSDPIAIRNEDVKYIVESNVENSLNPPTQCCGNDVTCSKYKLPHINQHSALGRALTKERPLKKSLKSALLTQIYEQFSIQDILYPSHKEVKEVAQALLKAYPYLSMNLPYESAKDLWVKTIGGKFINGRRRLVSIEDKLKSGRLRYGSKLKKIERKGRREIPHFYPISSAEADSEYITALKLRMKDQFNENDSANSKDMNLTFNNRRILCTDRSSNETTFSRVMKEYPGLHVEVQAIEEVARLFGTDDHEYYYKKYIEKFSILIEEIVLPSRGKQKCYIQSIFENFEDSVTREESHLFKLLGNIAVLVGESPKDIYTLKKVYSSTPMIHLDKNGTADIIIEDNIFVKNVSAQNCAYIWAGAFLFFDLNAKKVQKTYLLLQHIFFEAPLNPKFNFEQAKVSHVWKNLRK